MQDVCITSWWQVEVRNINTDPYSSLGRFNPEDVCDFHCIWVSTGFHWRPPSWCLVISMNSNMVAHGLVRLGSV